MMSDEDIRRLTRFFSIPRKLEPVKIVAKMDRLSLAIRYRELIDQGYVKNQSDLARHLGVSRAWITKVMNELKRRRIDSPIDF
jgi:DNA-binding MarR family transcriptional regulator